MPWATRDLYGSWIKVLASLRIARRRVCLDRVPLECTKWSPFVARSTDPSDRGFCLGFKYQVDWLVCDNGGRQEVCTIVLKLCDFCYSPNEESQVVPTEGQGEPRQTLRWVEELWQNFGLSTCSPFPWWLSRLLVLAGATTQSTCSGWSPVEGAEGRKSVEGEASRCLGQASNCGGTGVCSQSRINETHYQNAEDVWGSDAVPFGGIDRPSLPWMLLRSGTG